MCKPFKCADLLLRNYGSGLIPAIVRPASRTHLDAPPTLMCKVVSLLDTILVHCRTERPGYQKSSIIAVAADPMLAIERLLKFIESRKMLTQRGDRLVTHDVNFTIISRFRYYRFGPASSIY